METLLWVVVAVVLVGLHLHVTANRVDRLHARVDASRAALDAQLVRRSATAIELAGSGLLDPATTLLLAASAHAARAATPDGREQAESALSRTLRAALDSPGEVADLRSDEAGHALVDELFAACQRAQMARRFHNDAVQATRTLRRSPLIRYLRLAGHAALPRSFEIDDAPPSALVRESVFDTG